MNNSAEKKEKGAVLVVEAVFVFPIMFFILIFLLYLGNGYYQKAKVDSYTTQYALAMAAQCADPLVSKINGSVPKTNNDIQPYRYVFGANANLSSQLKKSLSGDGFFLGMRPSVKKCNMKFNNHVIYQTVTADVEYAITLPIRFFWSNNPEILKLTARAEVPVTDVGEFIRNTDMAIDYIERSETAQKGISMIKDAMSKVSSFVSGKNLAK